MIVEKLSVPIAVFLLLGHVAGASAQTAVSPEPGHRITVRDSRIQGKRDAVPRFCKPPHLPITPVRSSRTALTLADTTPPTPPESLQVFRESIHSIFAVWRPASDPESGIDYYAFALGTTPGAGDITWWQSTGLSLKSYAKSSNELGLLEGDTLYVTVYAVNTAGLSSDAVSSGPVVVQYEPLGMDSNQVIIDFTGGWTPSELNDLQWFLDRMLPILKEIYGPPSHSYTVTLVKDPNYSSSAVFFSGSNEIHMDGLYPQLLTHEIIHAFHDNVILSSDDFWRYDPTLSGFEESFAQGVSYVCMNRYIESYPGDPVVPDNLLYLSDYDWDYDFQNTDIITTTDFWSDGAGTGVYWLRYEMGAAAIIKIMNDNPTFPLDFNREYYSRLNADHALTTSRALARDIVSTVAPVIEGRTAAEWIDRQRIFDCVVRPGRKIWVRTQHYPGWLEYLIFQRVFYYETFSNGSEWAYWDSDLGQWIYHSLNGSTGYGTLRDWNGNIVAQKNLLIEPVDNPPVFFSFGNEEVNLSTDSDTSPWPGGDPGSFMLNLNDLGLYRLELSFGGDTTEVFRVMGDTLRNTTGVFGAVLNADTGVIFLDHESFPGEAPIPVVSGVFHGARAWASIPNARTGYQDSQPGRVSVTYIDDDGSEFGGWRNIDYGSWSGSQLFLFDTQAMAPVVTGLAHVELDSPNGGESLDPGAVATVSWKVLIPHQLLNWDLWYSTTGPDGPWMEIAMDLPPGSNAVESVHTYDWTIPNTLSSEVRVRVRMDNSGADYEDVSDANLTISSTTAVYLSYFTASRSSVSATLRWETLDATDHLGFHVYRQQAGTERERLTDQLLKGQSKYEFIDPTPPREGAEYWLAEISRTGESTWHGPAILPPASLPARLTLGPGVPNPFGSQTQITYSIPGSQHVELVLYDLQGRRIATLVDEDQGPGEYTVSWDGRVDTGMAPSGLYFLRLRAGKSTKTQKLMFVR